MKIIGKMWPAALLLLACACEEMSETGPAPEQPTVLSSIRVAAESGGFAVAGEDGLKVGAPVLEGASVTATVLSHGRGEKVRIFKFRRRKHSMKSGGHRQNYTELKIEAIAA